MYMRRTLCLRTLDPAAGMCKFAVTGELFWCIFNHMNICTYGVEDEAYAYMPCSWTTVLLLHMYMEKMYMHIYICYSWTLLQPIHVYAYTCTMHIYASGYIDVHPHIWCTCICIHSMVPCMLSAAQVHTMYHTYAYIGCIQGEERKTCRR